MEIINGKVAPLTAAECNARLTGLEDALYVLGGKWKLRIIITLIGAPKRFNEIQRLIQGISAKVLSTELKDLELNGFLKRNVFPGTPVAVEYELTEYSLSLYPVLDALSQWGMMHREKIKQGFKQETVVL